MSQLVVSGHPLECLGHQKLGIPRVPVVARSEGSDEDEDHRVRLEEII